MEDKYNEFITLKQEEQVFERMVKSSKRGLTTLIRNKIESILEPIYNLHPLVEVSCCDDYIVKVKNINGWKSSYTVKVDDNYFGLSLTIVSDIDNNQETESFSQLNRCVDYLLEQNCEKQIRQVFRDYQEGYNEVLNSLRSVRERVSKLFRELITIEEVKLKEQVESGISFTEVYFSYGRFQSHIKGLRVVNYSKTRLSCDVEITKSNGIVDYVSSMRVYALHDILLHVANNIVHNKVKNIW